MLPALKVKKKWLQAMKSGVRQGQKTCVKRMEVRKYPPASHTPKGHQDVAPGQRVCLVCNGEVWGVATLGDVKTYDEVSFSRDKELHCVLDEGTKEAREILDVLGKGGRVYGWEWREVSWFPDDGRPRSGEDDMPLFKGQRYGQVWSRNRLPLAREDLVG